MISTQTAHHSLADGQLDLLGAVSSVTGATTRIEMGGARLLVDCGVAQGREARSWRFPEEAADVDAVLLTHGHNDHVGSLPTLLECGFAGTIYGTRATLEIAEVVLRDGLRLNGASNGDIASFRRQFRRQMRAVCYNASVTLPSLDGTVRFVEAGHILGSSSIELCTKASHVIVSGDLGRPGTPILRDANTSWSPRPVDLVLMESTYGNRHHATQHGEIEAELERIVQRAQARGGHILVPAFAIGRTQALLYHLNSLVESGRVRGLPVAVDTPMGLRITDTYQESRKLFDTSALRRVDRGDDPLDFDGLYAVWKGRDSRRLRDVDASMLVIAGSGMCTGGRIVGHLRELLPKEETTVLFVGYQAHGTPGRAIQQAAKRTRARRQQPGTVTLDRERVEVRASIETLSGLSAHADQGELLQWLGHVPSPRRIALHHGEPEAQAGLAKAIEEQLVGQQAALHGAAVREATLHGAAMREATLHGATEVEAVGPAGGTGGGWA